jgi:hypothetical protein
MRVCARPDDHQTEGSAREGTPAATVAFNGLVRVAEAPLTSSLPLGSGPGIHGRRASWSFSVEAVCALHNGNTTESD